MCRTVRRLALIALVLLLPPLGVYAAYPSLLDAVNRGTVRASFRGAGASNVAVRIQRMPNGPLYVRVAPGTYFKPRDDVQGQVTLGVQYIDLRSSQVTFRHLETACTHIHRPAAHSEHVMTPTACPDERLLRLCSSVDLRRDDRQSIQNAVWAICNNASRRQLVFYGGRSTLAETVRLLKRADVDVGRLRLKPRSTSRVLHLW